MKKLLLSLVLILVICLNIFLGYKAIFNNPKNVIVSTFKNTYKELSNLIRNTNKSKISNMMKENVVEFNSNITIDFNEDSSNELSEVFENLNLKIKGQTDQKNNKLVFDFISKMEEEDLISFSGFLDNDIMYILFEDFYDKYVGIEDFINLEETKENEEDINYLSDKVSKLLFDSLKKEYFSSSKMEITLFDNIKNKISTTKNSMILNEKNMFEIADYVYGNLKKDDKSVSIIKDLFEFETEEEVLELLTISEEDFKSGETLSEEKLFEFSIYTRGLFNEPVRYEIEVDSLNKIILDLYEIENSNVYELNIYEEDNEVINLNFKILKTEDEVEKDKEYNKKLNLKVNIKLNDENLSFEMNIDTNYKVVSEFVSPNNDRLIKMSEMSEEDLESLYGIFDLFSTLIYGEDDYNWEYEDEDYDWEYDY